MRLVNAYPQNTAVLWVTSRPKRGDWRATIIVKAAFQLVPGGIAEADVKAPVPSGDAPAGPAVLRYASDFVVYKPKADLLVVGEAHAPDRTPTGRCRVSVGVGDWKKSLVAIGDRDWVFSPLGAVPGEPKPFVSQPIGYDRAYGGPGNRRNPLGRGNDIRGERPLPNIERPDQLITQPINSPEPAGFGPIAMTWQPRIGKVGSFDDAWRRQRWPWFPRDFDWSFFNAAPPDQQFAYFRGDETLTFEHLHPEHQIYRTRLPGMCARIVVERHPPDGMRFEELKVNLDTVWVDVPAEQLVLVWRGVTHVDSPRLRALETICTTLEPLEEQSEFDALCAAFMRQKAAELPNATSDADAAAQAAAGQLLAVAQAKAAEARTTAAQHRQTAAAIYRQTGFDEWRDRDASSGGDPMAALEKAIAALRARDPAGAKQLVDHLEEADRALGEAAPTAQSSKRWTRVAVVAALAGIKSASTTSASATSLAGAKLDGLDLSELDFRSAELSGATFNKASLRKARFDRANLAGADFDGCDATEASFVKANLARTNFKHATLGAATFTGACIEASVFAEIDLTGADFSTSFGSGADFGGAVLNAAYFARANLPRAQFTGASAADADFSHAILISADFCGAKAAGIIMENADLTNLRASRLADFSEGRFARVRAPRSVWQQARLDRTDFTRAILTQAQFPEASLCHADFDRARLEVVCFDDASLRGARLSNANLIRASFVRADLTEANVNGSNLYSAGLLDAELSAATFQGSFVVQTQLAS